MGGQARGKGWSRINGMVSFCLLRSRHYYYEPSSHQAPYWATETETNEQDILVYREVLAVTELRDL